MRRIVRCQVPGDATEDRCVGDAIHDRVEVGTPLARRVRRLRQGTIEQIRKRRQNDQQQPEAELAEADRHRRAPGNDHADDREHVWREPRLAQHEPDRLHSTIDRSAELAVEHWIRAYRANRLSPGGVAPRRHQVLAGATMWT